MSRVDSYYQMLEASAVVQHNIALILESKAREAEKSGSWIVNHAHPEDFPEHDKIVGRSVDLHEQVIELIDGLTKMENSLTGYMRAVLNKDESSGGLGSGGGLDFSGGMFNWGGDET